MLQLIYVSTALQTFESASIETLINKSSDWNHDHAISGFLFFDGQRFVQCLEGSEEEVRELYGRIARDARHRVLKAQERASKSRLFPAWSMKHFQPPPPLERVFTITVESMLSDRAKIAELQSNDRHDDALWNLVQQVGVEASRVSKN